MISPKNGFLVLESGEVFSGVWNGGTARAGEVVFNTSHSGYEEIASDPSYFSQIIVMTTPMQGNYSVNQNQWESHKLWIEGFICLQIQDTDRDRKWKMTLTEKGIPLLSEIDTRSLVLRLREGGTPWGAVVQAKTASEAITLAKSLIAEKKKAPLDWVWEASRKEVQTIKGDKPNGKKIVVLDFGSKENILRELKMRAGEVIVVPSRYSVAQIEKLHPDGIFLTNGPGDPKDAEVAPNTVKHFIGKLPIMGICMGHQILGIALGAKTFRLKFGHRGANHPIRDELLGKIYMSSQNHGYAVDEKTLPSDIVATHHNLNDMTVAGFYSSEKNCLGIQFHPESHPGPHEATQLFDFYFNSMLLGK